jgi:hypothetical protein
MAKKKIGRHSSTERGGTNAVEGIVINDLDWIFREQLTGDMGIDAHIEQVDDVGFPTGRLIGVQIKSGASHVRRVGTKKADKALVYYGSLTHLQYWLRHSLPVVLIVHIPKVATYWQVVNSETAIRTRKRFKLEIPIGNVFGAANKENRLAADETLMRYISGGGKVAVEMEDWVNKSLGRTPVNIYRVEKGADVLEKAYGLMYVGYTIKQVAQRLFPWAQIQIDEDFYEEHGPEESEEDELSRAIDADNGVYYEPLSAEDIRPYDEAAGEVDSYRLQLHMNEVGNAYLTLADYKKVPEDAWARRDDKIDDENFGDLSDRGDDNI